MLDIAKLAAAVHKSEKSLFVDTTASYQVLCSTWDLIKTDPLFAYRVAAASYTPWSVPTWQDSLDKTITLIGYHAPYTIISSDGSQIYPDRHQGISCGLINIGTVVIPYRVGGVGVQLGSEPYLVLPDDLGNEQLSPLDFINIRRQEYEFSHAVAAAHAIDGLKGVLFDGSLIFWHLQSIVGYENIVHSYCKQLQSLDNQSIPYGSYISAPKSKELLNLVRLQLCNFNPLREELYAMVNQCTDATIMQYHLRPGYRSIFFKSTAPVSALYPPSQQPYFCYLRHISEIGRLELPAWLVHNAPLCDRYISMVWDQLDKGNGYPIALVEAHEQAVVKGKDRDLFYMLLDQAGLRHNRLWTPSQKQLHKNIAAI